MDFCGRNALLIEATIASLNKGAIMRSSTRVLTVLIASLSLMGLQVQLAQAARDQVPPVLTVSLTPAYVVGDIIDEPLAGPTFPGEQPWDSGESAAYTGGVAETISWSATDSGSGVRDYDLWQTYTGNEDYLLLPNTQETSYTWPYGSDYNGDFGCGSCLTEGFRVVATDNGRNSTTIFIPEHPVLVQENNASGAISPEYQSFGRFTYTGTWSTSFCVCFLQWDTARTWAPSARATFTRTYEQGDHMALVMAKGPGRGRATIRVDGVFAGTIDTFATANTNRVVVFQTVMTAGIHTVSVTNLATPGRARIDVDAAIFPSWN